MSGVIYFALAVLLGCICLVVLRHATERSDRLRAVLESTADGILVVNTAGQVVTYNHRFAELWGIRESLLETEDDDALLRYLARQLRDPHAFLRQVRYPYKDPEAKIDDILEFEDGRKYEWHSEPQRVRGRVVGRVWGFRDVTGFHRSQAAFEDAKNAAQSANRAKTEFLRNMSHEIRTPMNGVLGMLEVALDSELNSEQRECLSIAKLSAESLLAVVNDITDFSKIEAGRLECDPVPFDVRECIEKTAKSLALPAHQKGLEIVCHVADSVPAFAVGDVMRIRQVLINLISNAVKFTEKGEVAIAVEGHPCEPPRNSLELRFSVRDSGIGIRPADQRRIFEPFSQADASTTRRYGGTGLGLSISQRLVELMGGHISLESEPGRGSTFRFSIPVEIADTPKGKPVYDATCLGGIEVLVIERNATNRWVLIDYLTRWGLHVQGAASGSEAAQMMKTARDTRYIVIADALTPGIDGLVPAANTGGRSRAEFILMLTAVRNSREFERRCRLPVAASLTKPVGQAELCATILRVVSDHHPGTRDGSSPMRTPAPGEAMDRPTSPSLRILLAEDNPVNQKVAVSLLQKDGHRVMAVSNGREALAALEREAFQLVLMDIEMPEMGGLEAAAEIRLRERASGGRIPIIALTAHAMSGDRDRCLAAGMDDYITKPIRRADLTQIVNRHVVDDGNTAGPERTLARSH